MLAGEYVAWLDRNSPRAATYELLEMLGIRPEDSPTARTSAFPVRNPDKENTVCTPRAAQSMKARKVI